MKCILTHLKLRKVGAPVGGHWQSALRHLYTANALAGRARPLGWKTGIEMKRKAVEAAMEKKEREFNKGASIRALAARMRAAADAAARGDTPIARLVRQKAQRNRVGLTRSRDKGEPRRSCKAVATDSGLRFRQGVRSPDLLLAPGWATAAAGRWRFVGSPWSGGEWRKDELDSESL